MLTFTRYNFIISCVNNNNLSTVTISLEPQRKANLLLSKVKSAFDIEEDFKILYSEEDIYEKLNDKSKLLSNIFGEIQDVNLKIQIIEAEQINEHIDPEKQKLFDAYNLF